MRPCQMSKNLRACVCACVRVCVFHFCNTGQWPGRTLGQARKQWGFNKNQIMNVSAKCECQAHDQFSRKYMKINQPIWGQKTAEVQQSMIKGYSRLKRPIARNVLFFSFSSMKSIKSAVSQEICRHCSSDKCPRNSSDLAQRDLKLIRSGRFLLVSSKILSINISNIATRNTCSVVRYCYVIRCVKVFKCVV